MPHMFFALRVLPSWELAFRAQRRCGRGLDGGNDISNHSLRASSMRQNQEQSATHDDVPVEHASCALKCA